MSEPLTAEQLAAWRVILGAARSHEEWAANLPPPVLTTSETVHGVVLYDDGDVCAEVEDNLGRGYRAEDFAALFALSTTALPALLAEVERLRAEVLAEREACARMAEDESVMRATGRYADLKPGKDEYWPHAGWRIAAAIRARTP